MDGSIPGGRRAAVTMGVRSGAARARAVDTEAPKDAAADAAAGLPTTYEELQAYVGERRYEQLLPVRGEEGAKTGRKNIRSHLKAWWKLLERKPSDPIDPTLGDAEAFERLCAELASRIKRNGKKPGTVRKFVSEMGFVHAFYLEALAKAKDLPSEDFYLQLKDALSKAIDASGGLDRLSKLAETKSNPWTSIRMVVYSIMQHHPVRHSRNAINALAAIENALHLTSGELTGLYRARHTISRSFQNIPLQLSRHVRGQMLRHLPEDYDTRPEAERKEIAQWVLNNILRPPSDYREYMQGPGRERYGLWFPGFGRQARERSNKRRASPQLIQEMRDLVDHMTAPWLDPDALRREQWAAPTAATNVDTLSRFLGALSSGTRTRVPGLGFDPGRLSLAILASKHVINWYLGWSHARRGFTTKSEKTFLICASCLLNPDTGWLVQRPYLASRLTLLPRFVTQTLISNARADWRSVLADAHAYCMEQMAKVDDEALKHRNPFEAINVVLDHDRPLDEYLKIATEIKLCMNEVRGNPLKEAVAFRDYLMISIAAICGFRQKNLRELIFKKKGEEPSSELNLQLLKRAELRFEGGKWVIFAPWQAFKNGKSDFFDRQALKIVIPNRGGLYKDIALYIEHYRPIIMKEWGEDGREFFVVPRFGGAKSCTYTVEGFRQNWVRIITTYGIFNPYTGRGAIKGLLPHGPHSIRDVLATHVLRTTGSFEQAAYAIQDSIEMVKKHYGKYGPGNKHARVAPLLAAVWGDEDDE